MELTKADSFQLVSISKAGRYFIASLFFSFLICIDNENNQYVVCDFRLLLSHDL